MRRRIGWMSCLLCISISAAGCGTGEKAENTGKDIGAAEGVEQEEGEGSDAREIKGEQLLFRDVNGVEYEVEVNPDVKTHTYDWSGLQRDGEFWKYYEDGEIRSRTGIDVSKYQPEIDWEKVKAAGVEFAFLRLGYRGYGEEGAIHLDPSYETHVEGARQADIEVGVYFFSQAVNEAEAIEEAEFVLKHLEGKDVTLPVVFDPEEIKDDVARTDDVSGKQFTKNTIAFCERIREAGYEPMIYSNMVWEALIFDMEELTEYPVWYADYEAVPQTPYQFACWQYTEKGRIDGIEGTVDLNLWITYP